MPWTIYRYILKELVRLLASAVAILVVVISFAAAIKPLSEGLLGLMSLVKYVLFLSPTMLGFTAPFAAAFAGTMVYSRMAADNEIVACRASGVGYSKLVMPALVLGLCMTATLFYLSNWVVPSFYHRAADMLEKDFTRMLVTQIEQGRPVKLGRMVLYADAVDDSQPPPVIPDSQTQPNKLIRLRGVAAGRTDGYGRLRNDAIAREADLLFYRVAGQTWVTLRLLDLTYHDTTKGDLISVKQWVVPQVLLPTPFRDSPRFMSWSELNEMRKTPDRFDQVREKKQDLVDVIAQEKIMASILSMYDPKKLRPRSLTLIGPNQNDRYELDAASCRLDMGQLVFGGQGEKPVRLEYIRDGQATRVIEARQVRAWLESSQIHPEPRIAIEMDDAVVYDTVDARSSAEHLVLTLPRASYPTAVAGPMSTMNSGQLLRLVESELGGLEQIKESARIFRYNEMKIVRKIVAQLHGRAALAISCTLVLLLSVVLSMGMRGKMPLVIYFWSFMPAVVVVIATRSGENLAGDPDFYELAGTVVIWSGNLIMAGCVGVLFRRLNLR